MKKISVGIVGVSGYTGLELIKILVSHPIFEICYISNTSGEENIEDVFPSLYSVYNSEISKTDIGQIAKKCELVFLCLPHKSSMEFAKEILKLGIKVVDLSADYRLKLQNYELNYSHHIDPQNLSKAVYGLPEYNLDSIKNASLVANPGCYPTASLLAVLPFSSYLENNSIFIDAKSGVSGAGKNPSQKTHFCSINENMLSYSPLEHRHQIEIKEKIEIFGNLDIDVNFIPHLSPLTRGMLVSVFARLKNETSTQEAIEVLKEKYKNDEFIRIKNSPVEIKSVVGTNFCDIFVKTNKKDIFISSAIDNLLRGASSQAVVNANIMCELHQNTGIPKIAYVP